MPIVKSLGANANGEAEARVWIMLAEAVTPGSVIVADTVKVRELVVSFTGRVTVRLAVPVPEVADRDAPLSTSAVQACPSPACTVTVAVVALKNSVCVSGVTENSRASWVMVTSWLTPPEVTRAVRCTAAAVLLFAGKVILKLPLPVPLAGDTVTPVPAVTPIPGQATVQQPNNSFVYLRSTKNSESINNVICQVPSGSVVTVVEWGSLWSKIRYDGMEGYMVTNYLK